MQHRGEIIKEAIYKSGYPITALAKQLGKSRRWMYLMFENNTISLDLVMQIGKIIHYDFTSEIKEFSLSPTTLNELSTTYKNEEPSSEYWKNKYLKLLEDYSELLKAKKE
jgi:predicted transcriptional regulator